MVMGKFFSYLALEMGKFTTYLPAYGAEVRGGTAHCMIIICDEEIYSPFVETADTLIIMNEPSLVRFGNRIKPGGTVFINKSLINQRLQRKDIKIVEIPFTDIAQDAGNMKCANTVALGAYLAEKKLTRLKEVKLVLDKMLAGLSSAIIKINSAALERGMDYSPC